MRRCSKCKELKEEDLFPWKNKTLGKRSSTCKVCQREYGKAHYGSNKDYYLSKNSRNTPEIRKRNKDYIIKYLLSNPCVDCGENDIEVLQFDHIDMVGSKGKRISDYSRSSINALQEEIDKCEVRCGNCHIRRTRRQMGFFREMPV